MSAGCPGFDWVAWLSCCLVHGVSACHGILCLTVGFWEGTSAGGVVSRYTEPLGDSNFPLLGLQEDVVYGYF